MKISYVHHFPGIEPDEFNEIWSNQEVINRVAKALPNIQDRETLEETHDDRQMRRKVRFLGKGPIPKIAQKVIKPHMLSWIEDTVYDKKERVYQVKCTPHFFANRVENEATIKLLPDGQGGTRRVSEGVLELKIPRLAKKLAEKIISGHLNENAETEYQLLKKEVAEYLKRKKG